MDERSRKFYAKVENYGGWQQEPAERIHSVFAEIVKPAEMGFVLARHSYWARQIDADIFQIIKLDALKGGARGLSYGLSLAYVPYPYVPKLRWHRTLKSVSLDLHEQPQVHLANPAHPITGADFCVASTMLGERCFRQELERGWGLCSSRISAWFDATRNLAGIIEKCDQHLARSKPEIQYVPGARLVRAFTFARMGRLNEAKPELDIFLDENHEGADARTNLHAALNQVQSK